MRKLGESKVSGVNQGNEGERWVENFLVLPQGLGISDQHERGVVFSTRGLFIAD